MRVLLSMAVLLSLAVPSAAHARSRIAHARPSASIFPSSRKLGPDPRIWVATRGEPKLQIMSRGRTVAFTIDDWRSWRDAGGGLSWVSVFVELKAGTFTVKAGAEQETFTIDPSMQLSGDSDTLPDSENVQFERMAIEHGERGDTLTIDAVVAPDTALYFLNHELPGASQYVWIGPGRPLGHARRFELPLSRLETSCASSSSITLSLYSTSLIIGDTLYPLSELTIDRGRVKLPSQSVGIKEEGQPWRPCPGAAVRVVPTDSDDGWAMARDENEPLPVQPPVQPPEAAAATSEELTGPVGACAITPPSQSRPWAAALALALAVLAGLCAALARRLPVRHLL